MPFLTPDTPPDETVCRVMIIPKDAHWLSLIDGAVSELARKYNWELFGTYTPDETSRKWLDIWTAFAESTCDAMSGCCYDVVLHRVTDDGDLEISINGGDWIPDPNDPRVTGISLPPPAFDETHSKCDAATNGRQHFADFIAQEGEAIGAAGNVFTLAAAVAALIVALFFGQLEAIPLIVPLIIASIPALIGLGQAAWEAYWTSDEIDKILCCLFCNIGDDGQFTDESYAAFIGCLETELTPGVAADVLVNQVRSIGLIGLNNMCAYGSSADADCSDCDCGEACPSLEDWNSPVPGTLGTVTARTATTITVAADFYSGFGEYVAYLDAQHPENFDICCTCSNIAVDGVDQAGATEICPCGQDGYTTSIHNQTSPTLETPCNLIGIRLGSTPGQVVVFTFHA